ncbi:MAG: GyrI-like domain-containing protein [Methanotrichaceae archaeon]|nr:GyrI-like domain-containing protein [Methanotrichaceae archaeon]
MIDISVIQEKPKMVVGIRKRGHYREIAVMLPQLFEYALGRRAKITGMPMYLWHEKSVEEAQKADQEGNADIEVCIPIAEIIPETDEIKCYELPGGQMARIMHRGSYESSGAAYEELFDWIRKNEKNLVGPIREAYLNDPREVRPEEILTEIFAPID